MFSKFLRDVMLRRPARKMIWALSWLMSRPFSVSRERIMRDIEAAISDGMRRRNGELL